MATRAIVPNVNEEGNIGTSLKRWLKGWFKNLFISNDITDGANTVTVAQLKTLCDCCNGVGLEINISSAYYIGDSDTDGSWRFRVVDGDLVREKRVSGSWEEVGRDIA